MTKAWLRVEEMASKGQKRWRSFLKRNKPLKDVLPLMHTTRAYSFDSILEGDSLSPSYCEVFKEELIYLYYGRPAYRARSGVNAKLEFDWPIAFIMDPEKITDTKRVFPFDTGAFAMGIYKEFFDSSAMLDDFDSGKTLDDARLVVGALYSSNHEYYSGGSRHNVEVRIREFEAQGVHELARLPGNPVADGKGRRDERSSSVELQTDKPVNLIDSIIAIVIPQQYLADAEVMTAIQRWKVPTVRSYPTLGNTSSDVWVGQIYQIVYEVLIESGYLELE